MRWVEMIGDARNQLLPPQRLAVAYAPAEVRAAFSLLLEFDARLSALVAGNNEALIGQLKLAWWRDAIAMDPCKRPKGEPLLGRLALVGAQDVGAAMSLLVDAWEVLLVGGDVKVFAKARSEAIFGSYRNWVGSAAEVRALGEAWAKADLTGEAAQEAMLLFGFRERKLRPLTILAMSVQNVSGPQLLWHALTGR